MTGEPLLLDVEYLATDSDRFVGNHLVMVVYQLEPSCHLLNGEVLQI